MSCGCVPIVSFLEGSTDLCVDEGISGNLTKIGDFQEISNKIVALYNDPKAWMIMSQNSIEKAKNDFSFESMAQKYLAIIDKIFNKSDGFKKNRLIKVSVLWKNIFPYHLIVNTKRISKKIIRTN